MKKAKHTPTLMTSTENPNLKSFSFSPNYKTSRIFRGFSSSQA